MHSPFYLFSGIIYLAISVFFVVYLFRWITAAIVAFRNDATSIFSYKFTWASGSVTVLLFLALIGLIERILYDLSRTIVGPGYSYFNDFSTIALHAGVTILVGGLLTVLNVVVAERRQKYAVALIPYSSASFVLALQFLVELGVYFYNHHTQWQFYTLMISLVVLLSGVIYLTQKRYVPASS